MKPKNPRYWIGVVSHEHVKVGVQQGFAQFCHGKLAPVKKLAKGDYIVYYSPKEIFGEPIPCRQFTAIGQVNDEEPYQVEQFPGFKPFRRSIRYFQSKPSAMSDIIDSLEFVKNKVNWGLYVRRGFFEVSELDFKTIAQAMKV